MPGYFGLLPDTVPPSRPDGRRGPLLKGRSRLAWLAATDNAGPIASYDVLLDGSPLATVPAAARRAIVRAFHPSAQTCLSRAAVDAAGNVSKPSRALVVVPTKRPTDLPRTLPHWAWGLYDVAARRRRAPASRAEEAARLVLALGRVAVSAVPPEELSGFRAR